MIFTPLSTLPSPLALSVYRSLKDAVMVALIISIKICNTTHTAILAQSVEHSHGKGEVAGSNPADGSTLSAAYGILNVLTKNSMSIQFVIQAVQVTSAILLIIAVLLQRGEANVGSAFGGGDISETGNAKRRGSERVVFIATFAIAIIFVASVIFPFIVG